MKYIYILRSEIIRLSKGILCRTFHWGRSWRSSRGPSVVFLVQACCDPQAPPTPTEQRGCFSDWRNMPCGKGLAPLFCMESVHRQPGRCNYCCLHRPQPENRSVNRNTRCNTGPQHLRRSPLPLSTCPGTFRLGCLSCPQSGRDGGQNILCGPGKQRVNMLSHLTQTGTGLPTPPAMAEPHSLQCPWGHRVRGQRYSGYRLRPAIS